MMALTVFVSQSISWEGIALFFLIRPVLEYGLSFGYHTLRGWPWRRCSAGGRNGRAESWKEGLRKACSLFPSTWVCETEGQIKPRGQRMRLQRDSPWPVRMKIFLVPDVEWTTVGMDSHQSMSEWMTDQDHDQTTQGRRVDLNQKVSFKSPKYRLYDSGIFLNELSTYGNFPWTRPLG